MATKGTYIVKLEDGVQNIATVIGSSLTSGTEYCINAKSDMYISEGNQDHFNSIQAGEKFTITFSGIPFYVKAILHDAMFTFNA